MDVARTSSLRRTDGWHSTNVGDEARVSDATVITAEDYLNAADVLMSMNDFKLAQQFFDPQQTAVAMLGRLEGFRVRRQDLKR